MREYNVSQRTQDASMCSLVRKLFAQINIGDIVIVSKFKRKYNGTNKLYNDKHLKTGVKVVFKGKVTSKSPTVIHLETSQGRENITLAEVTTGEVKFKILLKARG